MKHRGFRPESFDRDDTGYITHIVPPREITREDSTVSWLTIDTTKTIGVGVTDRLYLFGYNNEEIVPPHEIDSFKIGARKDDRLFLSLVNTLSGQAVQGKPMSLYTHASFQWYWNFISKEYEVIRNSGVNALSLTLFNSRLIIN